MSWKLTRLVARLFLWSWYNMLMIGMMLDFSHKVENGRDSFNNPTYTTDGFQIEDCLVAPVIEPTDRVESAALDRDSTVVRVHLPKASTQDIADCEFFYDDQLFRVIGRPVKFQDENTPTRWNRYFRAESIRG